MTMQDRIVAELTKRIIDNNFKDITIHMKKSGHDIVISPCIFTDELKMENVEWFLVYAGINTAGNDKIEKIAEFIMNYDKLIEEDKEDKIRLHAYYDKYHNTDKMDWDFYSNWYKDLYGHRPR